jgi:hypothetical protein
MTLAERLTKMQETLARHEQEFLSLRDQLKDPAMKHKFDGMAMEIRRCRLEIDALLNLPPAGRPMPAPKPRMKPTGVPRPGMPPRGRSPDWRAK